MVKRKTFTNAEIYDIASALVQEFTGEEVLPVKVNFFLQKNIKNMVAAGQEIEKSRAEIVNKYLETFEVGEGEEKETISRIPADKQDAATAELNDLFSLEQELSVNMIELEWFGDINMNSKQVSTISYMILDMEEEGEEE